MASKAANRAKYLYNKKYNDEYWERKGRELENSGSLSIKRTCTKRTVTETDEEELLPVLELDHDLDFYIKNDQQSDERYINALIVSNKALFRENKRLIKLLLKYQEIIRVGLYELNYGK